MEKSKLEKQNGTLKVVLLVLFIFGLSAVTISGYHYFPVLFQNTEPWEKKTGSREGKTKTKPEKAERAESATESPNQTAPDSNTQVSPPIENLLRTEAGRFTGAWEFTGGKGTTYHRTYSSPRLENANYVGDVTDENNVNFARYTVSAGNNLTLEILVSNALNTAGEKNTYIYKFSDGGKTFTLSRGGSVLSTWQRR